jgi:hypothetical protein
MRMNLLLALLTLISTENFRPPDHNAINLRCIRRMSPHSHSIVNERFILNVINGSSHIKLWLFFREGRYNITFTVNSTRVRQLTFCEINFVCNFPSTVNFEEHKVISKSYLAMRKRGLRHCRITRDVDGINNPSPRNFVWRCSTFKSVAIHIECPRLKLLVAISLDVRRR